MSRSSTSGCLHAQSLREAASQQASAAQAADERWRAERNACADAEARLLRSKADAAKAKQEQQVPFLSHFCARRSIANRWRRGRPANAADTSSSAITVVTRLTVQSSALYEGVYSSRTV